MEYLEQQIQANPARQQQLEQLEQFTNEYLESAEAKAFANGILSIPVIVHVVYNTAAENISDAQIASQIQVLTDDFRRFNADAANTPSDFTGVAADSEIEFCLTQTIRVQTATTSFGTNDSVKFSSSGGSDAVTPTEAMNMWVCNIGGGILGYAQFPGGSAATDGIVVDYRYFGTVGTATAPFDLGRTATHEVGHWLNLRHIWGDGGCSFDDFVTDTPLAGGPNYTSSPCTYPGPNSCGAGRGNKPGDGIYDMFQNYMDYSDDGCMNLFTLGQKDRMWAAINGSRPGLLTSACDGTPPPPPADPEICDNGIDDDGDGLIDCADGDCAGATNCAPPPGTCAAPTNLTHTRQKGGQEALLQWTASPDAQSYFVEVYFGNGTLYASGTITGTGATVSGLAKNDPYTWRVRSNCAGGAVSDWADGAFNARLAQAAFGTTEEVAVYPNPTNFGQVNISWDLASTATPGISALTEQREAFGPVTIRVHSLTGQTLLQRAVADGSQSTLLDISSLSAGVYHIQVTDAEGYSASTKLIKL